MKNFVGWPWLDELDFKRWLKLMSCEPKWDLNADSLLFLCPVMLSRNWWVVLPTYYFLQTKVVTLNDQSQQTRKTQWTNQNSKQILVAGAQSEKTRASKSWLVLVLLLIGKESGASCFNQSKSVVKQNYINSIAHVRYIKILTWLRGSHKTAHKDIKTKPNIDVTVVWPQASKSC